MLRSLLAMLALAAVTIVAWGCGGSTKSGSGRSSSGAASISTRAAGQAQVADETSGKALTRGQLVAAADRVCARANAKIAAFSTTGKPSTQQNIVESAQKVASYDRTEAAELRALIPPASLTADMKQIVEGFRTYGDDTARLGVYIQIYPRTKDPKPGRALEASAVKLHEHIVTIAKRDGMLECAKRTP